MCDSTSPLWVESCLILVPGFWWLSRTPLWVLGGSGEGEERGGSGGAYMAWFWR